MSGHRPRKRFGQHFLHDPRVIARIVAAMAPRPGQRIVEIGPGQGALTEPLLAAAGSLQAVEVDRDLAAELRARLGPAGLEVIAADALTHDFAAMAADGERIRVVGNLPYNISTPLLFHLMQAGQALLDLHIMVQREVAERMAAAPGSRAYGRLSVMVALYARVEHLFDVGAGAFRPPPKVESSVVRLLPHATPPVAAGEPGRLANLVRQAFSQRRKTLRRILAPRLDAAAIEGCGLSPMQRPETLSLADFARLLEALDAAAAAVPGVTHKACG